jgi:recombination protein RecA
MQSTILRAQLETVLGGRVATPFTDLDQCVCERVPSGIPALDAVTGGLPRGSVSEIFGLPSSGKTSILLSILAAATARGEVCAIVDGTDAFSPASGADSGIALGQLLWVRCHDIEQTLKVTDLLLQGGGFGVVAVDVSALPRASLCSVPLATWFRFQRSIEKTPTILAVVSENGTAKTCAALAVHCVGTPPLPGGLYESTRVNAEIVRSRGYSLTETHVCFDLHSAFSRPGTRS